MLLSPRFTAAVLAALVSLPRPAVIVHAASADPEQARCLALTLYWEARSEGREAMVAVGWVALNRLHSGDFPSSICGVVREGGTKPPCQFSYWCDGRRDVPQQTDSWRLAQQVSNELLTSPPPDPTRGALFFHASDIPVPWTVKRQRTAEIGRHVFYR